MENVLSYFLNILKVVIALNKIKIEVLRFVRFLRRNLSYNY